MQSNPNGQQVNLRTITAWQMFGALGAVRAEATYPASAQALENCTALAVSKRVPAFDAGDAPLPFFWLDEV